MGGGVNEMKGLKVYVGDVGINDLWAGCVGINKGG